MLSPSSKRPRKFSNNGSSSSGIADSDKGQEIDLDKGGDKTFNDLLAEGVPHKGGLAQLASAEKLGVLRSSEPLETNTDTDPKTSKS